MSHHSKAYKRWGLQCMCENSCAFVWVSLCLPADSTSSMSKCLQCVREWLEWSPSPCCHFSLATSWKQWWGRAALGCEATSVPRLCADFIVRLFLRRCAEARTSRCTCWSQWPLIKGWSRQHLSFSGSGTWWSPSQTQRGLYSWGSSGAAHVCRAPSLISEEETLWSRWET